MVWFDQDVFDDDGAPFLRSEVVEAKSYWQAMRERHKMELCIYEHIQNVITKVIVDNELR